MHNLLTNHLVLTYGPAALAAAALVAYSYFKRPPAGPSGVHTLFDTVDQLTVAFLKDPKTVELAPDTKQAFIDLAAAKAVARKSLPS